jgi:hypothetical protein
VSQAPHYAESGSSPPTLDHLREHVARIVAETPAEEIPAVARLLAQAGADCEVRLRVALAARADLGLDPEQMLTVAQAAKLAAVSPSYIKGHVRTGRLPSFVLPGTVTGSEVKRERQGKARRIRRGDLLTFLRDNGLAA